MRCAECETLTQNGKQLLAQILSPADAAFEVVDATPLPSSPNPPEANSNEGINKLKIYFDDRKDVTLSLMFMPLVEGESREIVSPEVKSLNDWSIADGDLVP